MLDIERYYQNNGGFWLAEADGKVIGTIGLMIAQNGCAVMKKFFVNAQYRSQGVGLALYKTLLEYAENAGVKCIILYTPLVARASHRLYEKAGFQQIACESLPVAYSYPDRDSLLHILYL